MNRVVVRCFDCEVEGRPKRWMYGCVGCAEDRIVLHHQTSGHVHMRLDADSNDFEVREAVKRVQEITGEW